MNPPTPARSTRVPPSLRALRRRAGGSLFSALAGCAVVLLSAATQAAADTRSAVEQAIAEHIAERVADEAAARGWDGVEHGVQISLLNDPAGLPACVGDIEVVPTGAAGSVTERLRVEARCHDPVWTVTASTRQSLMLDIVVTREAVNRGETLAARHLAHERTDITRARGGFIVDEEEVVGMSARRRLRAGQALTASLVEAPLAIERGQRVRLLARDAGIEASTVGEALADGRVGDVIRVRNLASDRVVDGLVVEPGLVTTTFH